MTTKACKTKHKKHTPITSEAQRGFFGAEYARKKAGKKGKTDMSKATLKRHLEEAGGKNLPKRSKKKHHSAEDGSFLASRRSKFGTG